MTPKDLQIALNNFTFYSRKIPPHMHEAIHCYLIDHQKVGDFLSSFLCNNLRHTVQYADDINLWLIPVYAAFFYNYAPADAWGSSKKYNAWTSQPSKGDS